MSVAGSTDAPVSATDAVIDFIVDAAPSSSALEAAAEQLGAFKREAEAGSGSSVADAVSDSLDRPSEPPAHAWILGASAAGAGSQVRWVAVCAAVAALDGAGSADASPRAVAIGYAVADAVAGAVGGSHAAQGWSVPATIGVIGAAAAAGSVLGLDSAQLRNVIGICAVQAAGLIRAEGTNGEALQLGKAASNAVEAALLARGGFTSSEDSLGGRRGLFALMSTDAEPASVASALAQAWS